MIREIATVVLRGHGFEVIAAANGVEAVELFRANPGQVHALVTDIMMPLMTGDRAAAEILREAPGLPVVFMSGLIEEGTLARALEVLPAAGVRVLKKPFSDAELIAALAAAGLR